MSQVAADALASQGNQLLQAEQYVQACNCFERAVAIFPSHETAWKGLGHALYFLRQYTESARAFDRAIGLRPNSATALWGGALAHAELRNRVVTQNYLLRTLELQPTWIEMVKTTPQLAPYVQLSNYARERLRAKLGQFAAKRYRHATNRGRAVEVGHIVGSPTDNHATYVTIGLCDHAWLDPQWPRLELLLAGSSDVRETELCGQILVNAAFHCMDNNFHVTPTAVIRDLVGVLQFGELSRQFPHAYFMEPAAWPMSMTIDPGPPEIQVLQLVPISESEYQYWREQGVQAFAALLQARRIDVANLQRPSAV
jgi:tetratricopeptide (TPR) repeat protein